MTDTAPTLDRQQQQRALGAMREYLSSAFTFDGKTIGESDIELDRDRKEVIEGTLKPLLAAYLGGKVALHDFKTQVNKLNNQHDDWGFTAKKGQMFFNMLVKTATDQKECDRELKAVLVKPADDGAAKHAIDRFAQYVRRLGEDHVANGGSKQGRPQVTSVPYFLSYFWQVHDWMAWPIYYTASVEAMESLNLWTPGDDLGENYVQFKRLFEELGRLFTGSGGKPFDHYGVEHVFWLQRENLKDAEEQPPAPKPEGGDAKPKKPDVPTAGGDRFQRLFSSSGILTAETVRKMFS